MIVRLFQPQFATKVRSGEKRQTVRKTPKRLPRAGQEISLREWTGAPYRTKQRVLRESTVTEVDRIRIEEGRAAPRIWINGRILELDAVEAFARADGFSNRFALSDWFREQHGMPFEGVVIHWQ